MGKKGASVLGGNEEISSSDLMEGSASKKLGKTLIPRHQRFKRGNVEYTRRES